MPEAPDYASQIREAMRAGVSRTDAHLMADLTNHAVDEAMRVISRVAETTPNHTRGSIIVSAAAGVGAAGEMLLQALIKEGGFKIVDLTQNKGAAT